MARSFWKTKRRQEKKSDADTSILPISAIFVQIACGIGTASKG
jgi:hypothetical protein